MTEPTLEQRVAHSLHVLTLMERALKGVVAWGLRSDERMEVASFDATDDTIIFRAPLRTLGEFLYLVADGVDVYAWSTLGFIGTPLREVSVALTLPSFVGA